MKGTKKKALGAAALLLAALMGVGVAGCSSNSAPYIGDNGNWYVDGKDTGVSATGPQGPQGETGPQGPKGDGVEDTILNPVVEQLTEIEAKYNKKLTGVVGGDGKYYSDYKSFEETLTASQKVAYQISEEGIVLLKNDDNALPLKAGNRKVSVFGWSINDIMRGGGGSGAGVAGANNMPKMELVDSLKLAGIEVNQKLIDAYKDAGLSAEGDIDTIANAYVKSTYGQYKDAAIVMFTRSGSEGSDLSTVVNGQTRADGTAKHSLELNDNEAKLLKHVKANFKKVIVLINSSNVMEMNELNAKKTADNLGVDAILHVGHSGNDGAYAIGKILTGAVNPSGHTVDLWSADFKKDPSWNNFGSLAQIKDAEGNAYTNEIYYNDAKTSFRGVEYREDIYIGYRYYETVATDLNAKTAGSGDTWYDSNVVYPFGYGLSYTNFKWELVGAGKGEIKKANETVTVKVKVTNTGNVAGKDVVQVYASAPYKTGGIEKASHTLMAFGKTDLLEPGESQVLTLQFVAQEMASFDWNDKNDNKFVGYELEAGNYVISVRRDSHTEEFSVTRTIASDIKCTTDYTTGNEITALFSQTEGKWANYNSTNETLVRNLLSRSGDMTQLPETATITLTDEAYDIIEGWKREHAWEDDVEDPWYVSAIPTGWTQAASHESDYSDVTIKLKDMAGITYENPTIDYGTGNVTLPTDEGSKKWDEFMNQLTWEEMVAFIQNGEYQRQAMESIGKPVEWDMDGPSQLSWMIDGLSFRLPSEASQEGGVTGLGTLWCSEPIIASTWNIELAYQQGRQVGNEALFTNTAGWYGPAMNTHRSPFGGRNFEYYSEDGMLAGLMGAAVVKGSTDMGLVTYIKHLALNEQETNREAQQGLFTYVTEQAIREIYMKPFEYAIKFGHSTGYMSSKNRIGNSTVYTNVALLDGLIRDEWNFQGISATDTTDGKYKDWWTLNAFVRAGTDLPLAGSSFAGGPMTVEKTIWDAQNNMVMAQTREEQEGELTSCTLASPTQWYHVRRVVQHILYTSANTNGIKNGVALSGTVEVSPEGGKAFNQFLFADAGATTFAIVEKTGTLPKGLTLNDQGVLFGTAAESGEFTISVKGVADGWIDCKYEVTVKVQGICEVTGLDNLVNNTAVSDAKITTELYKAGNTYQTTSGKNRTTWVIDSVKFELAEGQSLPAGLTLNADGTVTGTPAEAGTYTVKVKISTVAHNQKDENQKETVERFVETITIVIAAN